MVWGQAGFLAILSSHTTRASRSPRFRLCSPEYTKNHACSAGYDAFACIFPRFASATCNYLRACLHGGGGPQVGGVTRLAVLENWLTCELTCELTTPGSRGDVTRRWYVVARHVNRENGGRTTHLGGLCSFPLIICSRCNISVP